MGKQATFLDTLGHTDVQQCLLSGVCGGPAAQAQKPAGPSPAGLEFGFSTGIECSNPNIADANGNRLRREMLDECGHYKHWREDVRLVKEMKIPYLSYGLPNHLVHLGPDRYDWSFPDE